MLTFGHLGLVVVDAQDPRSTDGCSIADLHATPPGADFKQDLGIRSTSHVQGSDGHSDFDQSRMKNNDNPTPTPVDLADKVKGMYRLLDLISESGSNGYGEGYSSPQGDRFAALIRPVVDKVIIAQDSLQRFINTMSPGAYASITKVDFKTLDRLATKPLGIYGCKDQIVRLLRSLGAVDNKLCVNLSFIFSESVSSLSGNAYYSRQVTSHQQMYPFLATA